MQDLKGKTLKLKEDLTLVSIEDQAAILDVENRCYYEPNDTAFFILKLMEDGIPLDDMRAELLSEFDVDEETACADLDTFIEELRKLALIEVRAAGVARQSAGAKKERKAYHSPLLEHPTEIAVAAALISVSPGVPVVKPV